MTVTVMILYLGDVRKQILDDPRVTLSEHLIARVNCHADLPNKQVVVWRRACHRAAESECRSA